MFSVRGTDSNSFIAGKSVHNQQLNASGVMSVSVSFTTPCTVLRNNTCLTSVTSCTSSAATTFSCHASKPTWMTEQNLTPNQLWQVGQHLNPVADPEPEGLLIPEIQWKRVATQMSIIPGLEMMQLQDNIDPLEESECFGVDIYLNTVQYIENLIEHR
ncbi:hypothetical protein F7725_017169 [Dissostichus mawsoni]|uniref:Uncharacterized protein n=1 Tax=Dissostichus mawsoni TaxID=36200 RepID=A0A7J5Z4D4_DISMA|nr:hypothetical protein F7725_017169 [Dissostichus mawsoni]